MGLLDAPYAQLKDINSRSARALLDLGQTHKARSAAKTAALLADYPTSFVETWADLSAWSTSPGVSILNGKLIGGSSGANSCINHAFVVAAGESARIVIPIDYVSGAADSLMVGVADGTAGGAVTATGAIRGLWFRASGAVYSTDRGTTALLGTMATLKNQIVTIDIEPTWITVSTVNADGSYGMYYARFSRGSVAINNIALFNSDATAKLRIAPLGARKGPLTITPRSGIEGIARTTRWSSVNGNNYVVQLPPSYDSRVPAPLAICFHGNGSDEWIQMADGNEWSVIGALLNAGYIVLTAAYTPGPSSWGAQGSLDAYADAYNAVALTYNISGVVIHANSMGGIESLLTLAERRIPGILAWCGSSPTGNLAACYSEGSIPFAGTIRSAYGIAADGSDYATKTAGHDPALMPGDAFRGVPMRFYAATDDTVILKSHNADVIAAKVAPYAPEATVVATTGGHGGAASFPASEIVKFFNKYAA